MGKIKTSIQIEENVSSAFKSMNTVVNSTLNTFQSMDNQINNMDVSSSIGNWTSAVGNYDKSALEAIYTTEELVQMGFKTEDALNKVEQATENTSNTFENLNSNSNSVKNNFEEIEDEVDDLDDKLNTVNNSSSSLFSTLMGFSAVQKIFSVVTGQLDSAIDRMDTMTNFERTMTAITGDSDAASASLEYLNSAVKGTAYGLDTVASATQNFTTRGLAIGTATKEVAKWADAVAFYGEGTNEQLESVTNALGKMLSKGTVSMEYLNTLTDAGINAVGIYAQATGQSSSTVQDALSAGEISAYDFITTVSTAFEEETNGVLNISGAAKEAGSTWTTSIANMKAAVTRGLITMIDNINNALTNAGFGTILDGIVSFGSAMETILGKVGNAVGIVITVLSPLINLIQELGSFVYDNWSIIEPIVMGIVVAVGLYNAALGIHAIAVSASTIAEKLHSVATYAQAKALLSNVNANLLATNSEYALAVATAQATVAQTGFNTALLASPLTWILIVIIAIIAAIYAVVAVINKVTGSSISATGVICGCVNVVLQFFKNLGLEIADIALGIWNALSACTTNIGVAFNNVICNVQSWFYNLLSTALTVVAGICEALNNLPFVEFDYSGITSKASEYADKAAEASGNTEEYESISDAFNQGMSTFETFTDGWASDAYSSGYDWGSNLFSTDTTDSTTSTDDLLSLLDEYDTGLENYEVSDLSDNVASTADNTSAIADTLDITEEDLQYLRDIAEQEVINRFTTAEINVEMNNNNNINSDMDIDGVVSTLEDKIYEMTSSMAEGVHS